jgi:hypothetical protein
MKWVHNGVYKYDVGIMRWELASWHGDVEGFLDTTNPCSTLSPLSTFHSLTHPSPLDVGGRKFVTADRNGRRGGVKKTAMEV